jgi:hypothetical protein
MATHYADTNLMRWELSPLLEEQTVFAVSVMNALNAAKSCVLDKSCELMQPAILTYLYPHYWLNRLCP